MMKMMKMKKMKKMKKIKKMMMKMKMKMKVSDEKFVWKISKKTKTTQKALI